MNCIVEMESFETFLYRKFSAVFVDLLSEDVEDLDLLTVLKKTGKTPGLGGPYLHLAGPMNKVGTYTSPDDENNLHNGLRRFEECIRKDLSPTGVDEDLFKLVTIKEPIQRTFNSARSLKGALKGKGVAEAEANYAVSNKVTIEIENLEFVKVDKSRLKGIIKGRSAWKPDTDPNGPLSWPPSRLLALSKPKTKLWVIHQILRATKLTVSSDASTSAGGRLVIPILGGGRVEGSFETSRSQGNDATTSPSSTEDSEKHIIAFRAICCHFDSAGNCVGWEDDAGPEAPQYRGEEDEESNATNRVNVRDCFVDVPPVDICTDSDNDDEVDEYFEKCGDLLPLPITKCAM